MNKRQALPNSLRKLLDDRKERGLFRYLRRYPHAVDFFSNDYLGFSTSGLLERKVKEKGELTESGSTGSRLISGNSEAAESLERTIAGYHKAEAALLYTSGYSANTGFFSCVPQKNDLILYDELVHASIHDGMRASAAARFKFAHNDMKELRSMLKRHASAYDQIYIAVESVYSMDGDTSPLDEIVQLVHEYEHVRLVVDEAHGIGVFGEKGEGCCSEDHVIEHCFARIYTFGKAMGCHGAAIAGSSELKDYLINFSRPLIYTTALSPHSLAGIDCAYQLIADGKASAALKQVIARFLRNMKGCSSLIPSESAIQCFLTGDIAGAEELEGKLAAEGYIVKAVKSPTVKEGTERVRICLHSFNTDEQIEELCKILKGV